MLRPEENAFPLKNERLSSHASCAAESAYSISPSAGSHKQTEKSTEETLDLKKKKMMLFY